MVHLALLQISPVSSGKLSQQHLINKQQDQVVLVEAPSVARRVASTPKVGREAAAQCARVTWDANNAPQVLPMGLLTDGTPKNWWSCRCFSF